MCCSSDVGTAEAAERLPIGHHQASTNAAISDRRSAIPSPTPPTSPTPPPPTLDRDWFQPHLLRFSSASLPNLPPSTRTSRTVFFVLNLVRKLQPQDWIKFISIYLPMNIVDCVSCCIIYHNLLLLFLNRMSFCRIQAMWRSSGRWY